MKVKIIEKSKQKRKKKNKNKNIYFAKIVHIFV